MINKNWDFHVYILRISEKSGGMLYLWSEILDILEIIFNND